MKTKLILLFISALSMGGLLLTPRQPSSEAQSVKMVEACSPSKKSNPNLLQKTLDSIECVRLTKINHYEKQIKNSCKAIENQEKRIFSISMSTDSILAVLNTVDSVEVQTDTLKLKKRSWLKKQLDKLKNK